MLHQSNEKVRQRPQSAIQSQRKDLFFSNDMKGIAKSSQRNINYTKEIEKIVQNANQNSSPFQDETNRRVWHSFGSYVAKQMTNGKGVGIPKFGHFTFTAMEMNLLGTTNPQVRDQQIREPVFVVGKDFLNSIKSGYLSTADDGSKQLRPFIQQGSNGVIPKVKCNYFEIAVVAGISKEKCVETCEMIFKYIADQIRSGAHLHVDIPYVGRMFCKNSLAGVAFNPDLVNKTRGQTVKAYTVNNLFSSANATHNLNMFQSLDAKKGQLQITDGAQSWLKEELGIEIHKMPNDPEDKFQKNRDEAKPPLIGIRRSASVRNFQNNIPQSTRNKELSARALRGITPVQTFGQRPQSVSQVSYSHVSNLPQTSKFRLMESATKIFKNRDKIRAVIQSQNSRIQLRDHISSSTVYQILKQAGIQIELLAIKQLLQALGFNFNGISTSFTQLMTACKSYLHCETRQPIDDARKQDVLSDISVLSGLGVQLDARSHVNGVIQKIKEALHQQKVKTGEGLYDQFLKGKTQDVNCIDLPNFKKIVQQIAKVGDKEIADAFKYTAKDCDLLSYERFERYFKNEENVEALKLISKIKDIFYNKTATSNVSLYDIFCIGKLPQDNHIDSVGFYEILKAIAGRDVLKQVQSNLAFFEVTKHVNKMAFDKFEHRFRSDLPINDKDFQVKVVRHIREWMFRNNLSSENAFDALCRSVGRNIQNTLNRAQFQRAMLASEVGLSAAKVDFLFTQICNEANGEINVHMWLEHIFEDHDNPLQMIREIVHRHGLNQDDLLHQMKLKVWDNALTLPGLKQCIRNLDPSVSDSQITSIFKKLKDQSGLVTIANLIQNFTGSQFETVDFRQKVFKQLYNEIYPDNEEKLITLLQHLDKENQGFVKHADLLEVLKKVVSENISFENLERFVRFLDTDKLGRLHYMDFLAQIQKISNRNHDPFRTLVSRIQYFLNHNKVQAGGLVARLDPNAKRGIPIQDFAKFLKQKVDKKRNESELIEISKLIDVDRDGYVSENDINACVGNITNSAFWKTKINEKSKPYPMMCQLTEEKIDEILTQIKFNMSRKNITYKEFFSGLFDPKHDKMASFADFNKAINSIVPLAQPIVESLYAAIDKKGFGLINYEQFLYFFNGGLERGHKVADNFDWETSIVKQIKNWAHEKHLSFDKAFKCFDLDFDGVISKDDLKKGLELHLQIPKEQLTDNHIDRLFRLLDFFKVGSVQLSDFLRVMEGGQNPYYKTLTLKLLNNAGKNLDNTFEWKFSAVQQIGLFLSKHYTTLAESFNFASNGSTTMTFSQFKSFLGKNQVLKGFNLTEVLLHELFSELDPHKKGLLALNDWSIAFKDFEWSVQNLVELKSALQSTFADCKSAFCYFLSFGPTQQSINKETFVKAVQSLLHSRLHDQDLNDLWDRLRISQRIDQDLFRRHFEQLKFSGESKLKANVNNQNNQGVTISSAPTSKWENNVFEKLKSIFSVSSQNMQDVFLEIDQDGNGAISVMEFRNAIKRLGLGLTSKEIDQILARLDTNQDGLIDYNEFTSKFNPKELDFIMEKRAQNRIARLKELMIVHMISVTDAFKNFDSSKKGLMNFSDFNRLVSKAHELSNEKCPVYSVVKDLYDKVDIRKDGVVDLQEWEQTFGNVTQGSSKLSIKATQLTGWENSKEFKKICHLIAKNRKQLKKLFQKVIPQGTLFNLEQGRQAMDSWLHKNGLGDLTNEQLKCFFRVAQVISQSQIVPFYDYQKMLEVLKQRK